MNMRARALTTLTLCFSIGLAGAQAQDNGLRAQLFGPADEAMRVANEAQANILAPTNYGTAAEHYRDAESNLQRGRNLDGIRSDLAEAVGYFQRAVEATRIARVTLVDSIAAREDAVMADAQTYAAEPWREAEIAFSEAVRRLEDGNVNRARRLATGAEEQYRAAELAAIENNYLSGARTLIEQAHDQRVDRYAPLTLARAESLLARAERELRENRYDTDLPRSLARQANYEARHSMYLAGRIKAVSDRDLTTEQLLLESEAPLTRIAAELDLVAELHDGLDGPTSQIVETIATLRDDRETLAQRNAQISFLEGEMAGLEARLGEESERRKVQEQVQQRFEQLASVFTRQEAQVLRRGDEIIVRMGLNFDSGSASIKPEYYPLLRKIQAAIDVFPNSQVEVQGHTDSFGADPTNLALSEQRADAVRQYLLANTNLGATELAAVGYGETVPLANNETPEGRLRNRRIDLLIKPNLDVLVAALASQ